MEETVFEERLNAIRAMPEGPEKQQAIADLSRDYGGREETLRNQLQTAIEDVRSAYDMPQSRVAGPSGNPFAVEVAPSALQYAAQGLRGYNAAQRRDEAREGLESLSRGREAGLGGVMGSGMQRAMADRLRGNPAMQNAGFGTLGMDPAQMARIRRLRMG